MLLTVEEIYAAYLGRQVSKPVAEILAEDTVQESDWRIAKAQLKKMVEWGKKWGNEMQNPHDTGQTLFVFDLEVWKALLKEVE